MAEIKLDPEKQQILIEKADNGYIVKYFEPYSDDSGFRVAKVLCEADERIKMPQGIDLEEDAFRRALIEIKEYFGHFYSDHRKVNLRIVFLPNNTSGIEEDYEADE